MNSENTKSKSLTSWVQEHAVPIAGLIVSFTYIMIPYALYSSFFGHFNVPLSSVGLDRGTILTTAALSLLFSAALVASVAGISFGVVFIFYVAIALFHFIIVQAYRFVQRLSAELSKTAAKRPDPSEGFEEERDSDREESKQHSDRVGSIKASAQGSRSLRVQLSWLAASAIGFYLIVTYLWFHLPRPRNAIFSSNWISVGVALWISVFLVHWIGRKVSEQDFPGLVHYSRRFVRFMLQGAIATSILMVLFLSLTIGDQVAEYIERHGVPPNTVSEPILNVSSVRCVRLRYLDSENMSLSKNSRSSDPVLYLGESNDIAILYDSPTETLMRVPVANLAMEPLSGIKPSPCAKEN